MELLKRDSTPLALTDLFIRRPCLCIISQMIFLFMLFGIANQLDYFALDPPNNREYVIWDNDRAIEWDKLTVAEEWLLANQGGDGQ